jgi:hypothetical protein
MSPIISIGRPDSSGASSDAALPAKQVRAELAALKGGFHTDRLEEVIESRTSMLEVLPGLAADACT